MKIKNQNNNKVHGKIRYLFFALIGLILIRIIIQYFFYNNNQKKTKADEISYQLLFSPESASLSQNQDISTKVKIKATATTTIRGYYFKIYFDKNKLKLKNLNYRLGVVSRNLGNDTSTISQINEKGEIKIQGEVYDPSGLTLTNKETDVVDLVFTAQSVSGTAVSILSTNTKIYLVNQDWSITDKNMEAFNIFNINGGGPTMTPMPPRTIKPTCGPEAVETVTRSSTISSYCSSKLNKNCLSPNRWTTALICHHGPAVGSNSWTAFGSTCVQPYCDGCVCLTPNSVEPTLPPAVTKPIDTAISKLNLKLKLQGVTKMTNNQYKSTNIQVKLVDTGTNVLAGNETGTFIQQNDFLWSGSVNFSNLKVGSKYKLLIKGEKHLSKKICDTKPTETKEGGYNCINGNIGLQIGDNNLDLSGIYILAGDIKVNGAVQDGVINALDLGYIINNLRKKPTGNLVSADINYDGNIDTQDYALMIKSLAVKYDEN